MERRLLVFACAAVLAVVVGFAAACGGGGGEEEEAEKPRDTGPYVGAEKCGDCHASEYNSWKVSGHPYMLMKAADAKRWPLPLPEGYTWDDIEYVVGGYKWKARYLDKDGKFITTAGGQPGSNQYNTMTGRFVDYHAGQDKDYDCGKCHTTGYSEEGNQDGKPGLIGTWMFEGVQCEACHGPGEKHVESKDAADIKIDSSAEACGSCHIRGESTTVPAKGGFIRHHEQYNELLAGAHDKLDCVDCHSAHTRAEFSIQTECADCHDDEGAEFTGSTMANRGVVCTDCHMPMATKSAESLGPHQGDIKTHLFRINTDPTAPMFSAEGDFANDYVTLDFACLQCHQDQDIQWAAGNAKDVHSAGK